MERKKDWSFLGEGNVRLIFDSTREVRESRLSRSSGPIWDLWSDLVLSMPWSVSPPIEKVPKIDRFEDISKYFPMVFDREDKEFN